MVSSVSRPFIPNKFMNQHTPLLKFSNPRDTPSPGQESPTIITRGLPPPTPPPSNPDAPLSPPLTLRSPSPSPTRVENNDALGDFTTAVGSSEEHRRDISDIQPNSQGTTPQKSGDNGLNRFFPYLLKILRLPLQILRAVQQKLNKD